MVPVIAPYCFSTLGGTGLVEAIDAKAFCGWDLEESHGCVSCGSDEYDVVIKFSSFGWVTSGDWMLRGEQCSWWYDWRCSSTAVTGRLAKMGKFQMEGWALGHRWRHPRRLCSSFILSHGVGGVKGQEP